MKAVAGAGRKRSSGHLNVCTPCTRFEEEGRQGKSQAWAPSQENLRSPSLYLHQHPPPPALLNNDKSPRICVSELRVAVIILL